MDRFHEGTQDDWTYISCLDTVCINDGKNATYQAQISRQYMLIQMNFYTINIKFMLYIHIG